MINHHIHKNIKTVDEKIFILKNYKNFEINYSSYMNKIGFSNIADKFKNIILKLYNCDELSVCNKNKNTILVKYIGISKNDFVNFLSKFKYDRLLIYQYENLDFKINNEIMIEYDVNKMLVNSTGFYGIV